MKKILLSLTFIAAVVGILAIKIGSEPITADKQKENPTVVHNDILEKLTSEITSGSRDLCEIVSGTREVVEITGNAPEVVIRPNEVVVGWNGSPIP